MDKPPSSLICCCPFTFPSFAFCSSFAPFRTYISSNHCHQFRVQTHQGLYHLRHLRHYHHHNFSQPCLQIICAQNTTTSHVSHLQHAPFLWHMYAAVLHQRLPGNDNDLQLSRATLQEKAHKFRGETVPCRLYTLYRRRRPIAVRCPLKIRRRGPRPLGEEVQKSTE